MPTAEKLFKVSGNEHLYMTQPHPDDEDYLKVICIDTVKDEIILSTPYVKQLENGRFECKPPLR